MDLATRQIRDPRLSHTQSLSRPGLGKLFLSDERNQRPHHGRTDPQILRLRRCEAQVGENIMPGFLPDHFFSASIRNACWNRVCASSISAWDVFRLFFRKTWSTYIACISLAT